MNTLHLSRKAGAGLTALALVLLTPALGQAQHNLSFDSRGGVALPAGDLADVSEPGAALGAMIGYQVHQRITLFGAGDVGLLRGKKLAGATDREPGLNLWQYSGGAEFNLLNPERTRWAVLASLGAGAATFDSEVQGEESLTRFSTNGGLRVGYRLGPRADAFVGGQTYLIFTDESRQGSDTNWVVPLSAGLKIRV